MENSSQISRVGVVGTGLMGSGIAAVFAAVGRTVFLYDKDPKRLDEATERIVGIYEEMRGAGLTSLSQAEILSHIKPVSELADLRTVEFIIEAVPEVLEIKQALYRELETMVAERVILASNTSGFMSSIFGIRLTPFHWLRWFRRSTHRLRLWSEQLRCYGSLERSRFWWRKKFLDSLATGSSTRCCEKH